MGSLFLKLVNMSLNAGWLVLAVMLLRLLLKRAPRRLTLFLWVPVGLRLCWPFSWESFLSLLPSSQVFPEDILLSPSPTIQSGFPAVNNAVNPMLSQSLAPSPGDSVNPLQVITHLAAIVWAVGVLGMLLYAAFSYWRLRHRVREAAPGEGGLWICDRIPGPFVLGLFRPRIYLPSSLFVGDLDAVTAHERAHIARRDHWWKPLGYLFLAVYWFHPLIWAAYLLFCRDLELACDETVLAGQFSHRKQEYADALIRCSAGKSWGACPLAFGEGSVKTRILSVLRYKKPAVWLAAVCVLAGILLAVCFLTDPPAPVPADPTTQTTAPTSPTTDTAAPEDPELARLWQRYPQYFDLDTTKGLEVAVWQMARRSYSCVLVSGTNFGHSAEELLKLPPASMEEMRKIVASYGLPRERIAIVPIHNPLSSYLYVINDTYRLSLYEQFWYDGSLPDHLSAYGQARFDIDGDGKPEDCYLGLGPTSGLFTFTVSAYSMPEDGGKLRFFGIFTAPPGFPTGFAATEDGLPAVQFKAYGTKETVSYHLIIRDGYMVLKNGEDVLLTWGEQGHDSPFAPGQ